jgi:hypothetical protein
MGSLNATVPSQVLFGVIGIGVTVLVFVILGNPSAGGAYQPPMLPPFWRAISTPLPNGAGVDCVRRIVYFGSHGITGYLIVIGSYAVAGAVAIAASRIQRRRARRPARRRPALRAGQPGPCSSRRCPPDSSSRAERSSSLASTAATRDGVTATSVDVRTPPSR